MVGVSELIDKHYPANKKVFDINLNLLSVFSKTIVFQYNKESYRSLWHVVALMTQRYIFSSLPHPLSFLRLLRLTIFPLTCSSFLKGAVIVRSLSARDPSALGLDTYCKQYYLCLAAATATIKWYVCSTHYDSIRNSGFQLLRLPCYGIVITFEVTACLFIVIYLLSV